jgi:hypothetical protein
MKLISLQVTGPAKAAGSVSGSRRRARAPLLTAAEISEVLGTAVNLQQFGIPSGDGAIYRGGGGTLSVTTARGGCPSSVHGQLATSAGRCLAWEKRNGC